MLKSVVPNYCIKFQVDGILSSLIGSHLQNFQHQISWKPAMLRIFETRQPARIITITVLHSERPYSKTNSAGCNERHLEAPETERIAKGLRWEGCRRYHRKKKGNLCSISTNAKLAKLISTKSIYISNISIAESMP